MKMVKTSMKTQHQHVMPPRKEKGKGKGKEQSKSTSLITGQSDGRPRSPAASEHTGGQGKRCQDSIPHKARHGPSLLCFSVLSLKI